MCPLAVHFGLCFKWLTLEFSPSLASTMDTSFQHFEMQRTQNYVSTISNVFITFLMSFSNCIYNVLDLASMLTIH